LSITTGNASGTGVTSNSGSITLNVGTSTNGTPGAINIGTANIANMVQLGSTALNAGTQVVAIGNNNTAGGTTNVTIGSGTSATGGTTTLQAKGALTVAGGTVAIRPAAAGNDAAGAVQIQNSSGAALLSADTSAMRLSVGTIGTATGQLYVAGKLPTAAVATLGTGASTAPGGLYVQGRYAYVVLNAASPKLQIIDISNPSSPALLGSVATGAGTLT
jgi:trimeric autotransporter adhesin